VEPKLSTFILILLLPFPPFPPFRKVEPNPIILILLLPFRKVEPNPYSNFASTFEKSRDKTFSKGGFHFLQSIVYNEKI